MMGAAHPLRLNKVPQKYIPGFNEYLKTGVLPDFVSPLSAVTPASIQAQKGFHELASDKREPLAVSGKTANPVTPLTTP